MKKSLTRIRTSHVGRLPPPKGLEDMPARLANCRGNRPRSHRRAGDASHCRNGAEAGAQMESSKLSL
jgi:hypothetical protein